MKKRRLPRLVSLTSAIRLLMVVSLLAPRVTWAECPCGTSNDGQLATAPTSAPASQTPAAPEQTAPKKKAGCCCCGSEGPCCCCCTEATDESGPAPTEAPKPSPPAPTTPADTAAPAAAGCSHCGSDCLCHRLELAWTAPAPVAQVERADRDETPQFLTVVAESLSPSLPLLDWSVVPEWPPPHIHASQLLPVLCKWQK